MHRAQFHDVREDLSTVSVLGRGPGGCERPTSLQQCNRRNRAISTGPGGRPGAPRHPKGVGHHRTLLSLLFHPCA